MVRPSFASRQTLTVFAVLLERPDDWHYGYELSKSTGLKSGTLYPLLARLADHGLLTSRWVPSEQAGRPPRHAYLLTGQGQQVARERLQRAHTASIVSLKAKWA